MSPASAAGAYGTPPGQSRDGLFVRDTVVTNEVVETVPRGALHLAFNDGSIFRLGSNSRATLDRFVYDPGSKDGQFEVNLRSGMFRLKTGQMKKEGILVITPVAFISVTGTDFIVQVFLNGAIVVAVLSGQVVLSPLVPGVAPAVVTAGSVLGVSAQGQILSGVNYPPRDRGLDDELPGSGNESQGDAEGGPWRRRTGRAWGLRPAIFGHKTLIKLNSLGRKSGLVARSRQFIANQHGKIIGNETTRKTTVARGASQIVELLLIQFSLLIIP